jgi:peptidoglycan glycosyltransferase
MGRRIRWMGAIMIACMGLVIAQLVNIQLVKANKLANSPYNPRVSSQRFVNPRGAIYAADGTVLAKSIQTIPNPSYPFHYIRQYPQGSLYAGITGYDSPLYYGTSGIEEQYNAELSAHKPAPQNLSQLLFRESPPTTTDSVTLTVEPALQQEAWNALTATPGNHDGAVVVLNPKTGAVLAMVSNPTFDPNQLVTPSVQTELAAHAGYTTKDAEGFEPLRPIATREFFFPGSTMKTVTSTAVFNLKPQLAGFDFPQQPCVGFSDSNRILCNDGTDPTNSTPCGGTMTLMLPQSCDPGYGELGIQVGPPTLRQQAELFGYNSVPPIDLPGTIASTVRTLPDNAQALQAYTAIGQDTVETTALQNAMVAAGIANGGVVMTPHLMATIHDAQGNQVQSYAASPMPRSASAPATQQVTSLMESVITNPTGTAAGVGFPPYLCAAVKTGTAQTGLNVNHDWMIGFAPANNPQIAVAVVVPYQQIGTDGAQIAGPIVNAVMQAALPPGSVNQPCNV